MKNANRTTGLVLSWIFVAMTTCAFAQDWPQWRGPNRDGAVSGFRAPKSWPKELAQKWKVTVGRGDATPALVGDKLYVIARQETGEVILCLDAATGKEIWRDQYEALAATGPAGSHPGPRSSPTVAGGKVVTLGVRGTLSCFDAATGKKLWSKDDFQGAWPRFFTSSSPIVLDGLCIAQVGGPGNGGIVAYDLATGNEKWKWTGDSPAYGSPVLMIVSGTKVIITPTEKTMVAVAVTDGKLLWQTNYTQGRYNAATPIVDEQTLVYAGPGRGMTAVKIEKSSDGLAAKELWSNTEKSVIFNTPVLKNGLLYGLTQANELFCINVRNGQTAWAAPVGQAAGEAQPGGGGRGGRGMGGTAGYGSIVDAGTVLLALTPDSQLIVFQPNEKAYTELARIKVAGTPTYAHPVVASNRVFIKDQDSLTLWTIE